jgi:uncharacterized iron-regulated membrane protein
MIKIWSLKLHRWVAFLFALPLAILFITGIILSLEPFLYQHGADQKALTIEKLSKIQKDHDPEKKAKAIAYRSYTGELTLLGVGKSGKTLIDVNTGSAFEKESKTFELFATTRKLHETLLIGIGGKIVLFSTFALLSLVMLGLLNGLPRFRNTLSGWHKGLAWVSLPLLIASPLTGLTIAYKMTFNPPIPAFNKAPVALWDAVDKVTAKVHPSDVIWIRPFAGSLGARVVEDKRTKVYLATRDGLIYTGHWIPRLIHEGTWHTFFGSFVNLLTSLILTFMLASGIWMWSSRKIRRSQNIRKFQANTVK